MLLFLFLLATTALFLQAIDIFPLAFNAYTPWIALVVLRHPLRKSPLSPLIAAASAGFLSDLLSDLPLGLYPISYALCAGATLRFRHHFLYEEPLHLALFSSLVSFLSSLLQLFFLFLFDRRVALSGQWIFIDWIGMSLIDGIYALIWFSGPLLLLSKTWRNWSLFWLKKKHSRA